MAGGTRREARERALSLLYEADAKDTTPGKVLADLRGYVALLDAQKLGLDLLAYVNVRLEKRGGPTVAAASRADGAPARAGATHADLFRAAVQTWPEVVACHAMTGEMDYLLRVQVEDMAHFSRFVQEQLLHHPSVIDVKTSFSLERIKETTALPIL